MTPNCRRKHAAALLWVLCATALGGVGCEPQSNNCQHEPWASSGLTLGEPKLAPLPQQPSRLPHGQSPTAISTDGTGFLVVWAAASSVLAVRLSANGAALDMPPLVIGPTAALPTRPSVTHNGANYVVAWRQQTGGAWAARVTAEGRLLDPGGVPLGIGVQVSALALGTTSGRTLLAWATADKASVAALSGVALGPPTEVPFSGPVKFISSLALAGNASTWALAANSEFEIGVSRPRIAFFEWDPFVTVATFDLGDHAVRGQEIGLAAGEGRFLAMWTELTPSTHIEAQLLTRAGPESASFSVTSNDLRHLSPQVSFDGTRFQAVFDGYPRGFGHSLLSTAVDLAGALASPGGSPIVTSGPGGGQSFYGVAVASAGGQTLATYTDTEALRGAWLADSGGSLADLASELSLTPVFRERPRVLATSDGYVVLWREVGQAGIGLGGARLGPEGEVLSLVGSRAADMRPEEMMFDLYDAAAVGEQVLATVPTDGEGGILMLRPGGNWFTPLPAPAHRFNSALQVAASGQSALVSWPSLRTLSLEVLPVSVDGDVAADARSIAAWPPGGFRAWAIEPNGGGFGVACLAQSQITFLNLDLTRAVLKRTQIELSKRDDFLGPMRIIELGGTPTALFRAVDAGVSLLGAIAEGGVPHFPAVLGEGLLSDRLAGAPLGTRNLLGWVASSDGGTVPRGAWLEDAVPTVVGEPFTWPLEAGVTDLDVATRSPTDGLIAYAVGSTVERNIAWRRISIVDAGRGNSRDDANTCGQQFLTQVLEVGPSCSHVPGNMAGLLLASTFALRLLRPRRPARGFNRRQRGERFGPAAAQLTPEAP